MSELLELAERCEKAASGADRELEEAIMAALFVREQRHIGCQEEQVDGSFAPVKDSVWVDPATDRWVGTGAREFTRSLDDAMTLVPPTTEMERPIKFVLQTSESGNLHWASIKNWKWGTIKSATCKSLPLALCAAALRARAALAVLNATALSPAEDN